MANLEPKKPRYASTWDVKLLLTYLEQNDCSTLKTITFKTATLIALTTASRCSEIASLSMENTIIDSERAIFQIPKSKTWNKRMMKLIHIHKFSANSELCPLTALNAYLSTTQSVRDGNKSLFLTLVKPHKPVSSSTISRWIKGTMELAGIDTSFYKAHSTRSASTSKAARAGVTMESILKVADWSNVDTFRRFYHRDQEPTPESTQHLATGSFTTAVLSDLPDITRNEDCCSD